MKPIFLILIGVMTLLHSQKNLLLDKSTQKIRELAKQADGVLAIAFLDLSSQESIEINTDEIFPQGSAIKIPIMIEVFKQANAGLFSLDQKLRIDYSQKVGGAGILFELDESLKELSVRNLVNLMIVLSDNFATNILIDLVGMQSVNQSMKQMGYPSIKLQRKMMDSKASARGDENLANSKDAAKLMRDLYQGKIVTKEASQEMLRILSKWKSGDINSQIPESVPVAFKPGEIPGVNTEWAIVLLDKRPFVLVLMEKYGSHSGANPNFRALSKEIYQCMARLNKANSYGTYSTEF